MPIVSIHSQLYHVKDDNQNVLIVVNISESHSKFHSVNYVNLSLDELIVCNSVITLYLKSTKSCEKMNTFNFEKGFHMK